MMIGDIDSTRFFTCSDCRESASPDPGVRAIANNGLPSVPCGSCGGSKWDELTGDDRREVIENLGPDANATAVVFYCRRCRVAGVQVKRAGEGPSPCPCGSRYFHELVGPERIDFLREWRGTL